MRAGWENVVAGSFVLSTLTEGLIFHQAFVANNIFIFTMRLGLS